MKCFLRLRVGALVFLLPLTALAQVYRWVDENGKVHYSERPMQENAQAVRNRNSSGAEVCHIDCQRRLEDDRFKGRLEEEMRNVPPGECTASYNRLNRRSQELAEKAVKECKLNWAMSRIDPSYKPSTKAQEASRRQNQAVNEAIREGQRREEQRQLNQKLDDIARQQRAGPEELRLRNSNTGATATCTRGLGNDYKCR